MKNTYFFILSLVMTLLSNVVFSQDPTILYAAEIYGDGFYEIDTADGTYAIITTSTITSDFGDVSGTYGLALNPITEEMFALYQSDDGACDRRLGTIDLETAIITDIANAGNLTDIEFGVDGTLYGTTGTSCSDDYSLVSINTVTGATTPLLSYAIQGNGGSIGYNPFTDEMFYMNSSSVSTIDLDATLETTFPADEPTVEIHGICFLEEDLAWVVNYTDLYSFQPSTGTFTYLESVGVEHHSIAFGPPECLPIEATATATTICEGDEVTLTTEAVGTVTWDMGIEDGVAFVPGVPGTYTYTATSDNADECPESVTIEVLGPPTVIPGAGDLNFCVDETITLSAGGDADTYVWNDGEPLELNPPAGTYTFTLTGSYDAGCLTAVSESIVVTVHDLPIITATASANPVCFGNEVTLSGSGALTYEWDAPSVEDGIAFETETVGTTTYTVTGTDDNECSATATLDLEVVEEISIASFIVEPELLGADGSINITIAGGAPTYTFDWDNDGTGDFDDDEDLTGITGGTYTVVIQGGAGCSSTATYTVDSQLSVKALNNTSISLYPNPTTQDVTIEAEGAFNYQLLTVNGAVLVNGTATDKALVSLEGLAAGTYIINLTVGENTTTVKVVKE